MPFIGAHVSAAGGLQHCFANAQAIGATCIQIFGAAPQSWRTRTIGDEEIALFKKTHQSSGVGAVFLHAPYLVNLGSPNPELYKKSIDNLISHLTITENIGAQGLIFHIGSSKGQDKDQAMVQVAKGMLEVLRHVPGKAQLIMENAAGGGDKIGKDPEEIGFILKQANHPRIKVCIDTQHAFAASTIKTYSVEEISTFAKACDTAFGLEHVVVMHINDSKTECGSNHDRHENIGEGFIGKQAFSNLSQHKFFGSLPWILEVPGYENKGPDKQNIDLLTSLAFSPIL